MESPKSFPDSFKDHWDDVNFVQMPCSVKSCMPSDSGIRTVRRWEAIKFSLSSNIPGAYELEYVILSYNQDYRQKWNFFSLHDCVNEMDDEMRESFFIKILPGMQALVFQLPILFTESLPILRQNKNKKISITQEQAACLLANAFFCTFPNRNLKVKGRKLPYINFSNLYGNSNGNTEKLKFIINYFTRIIKKMPVGTLTYTRQYLRDWEIPKWNENTSKFCKLTVFENGTIEDNGENMLQADSASKDVGGGTLGQSFGQEEIRFMIFPEMILACLFTEGLTDNEVLIVTGCERFSSYTVCSGVFKFDGDFRDETLRDSWGRRSTEVVAMDALVIRNFPDQFRHHELTRELKKAYCAFSGKYKYKYEEFQSRDHRLPPVCTGNWGCGAFGGDKQLKALIQLMAASLAERDVHYYTFGDAELCEDLRCIYEIIVREQLSVKCVFQLITDYGENFSSLPNQVTLFDFLFKMFNIVKRPKKK